MPPPRFTLAVQYASPGECPSRSRLRRWVAHALALALNRGPSPPSGALGFSGQITLVLRFVDEPEGAELNRQFRGKPYPTNVLTFGYGGEESLAADIVLCVPVVEREAREQGKALGDHYAHLVVHGILHACGYDHENESDAEEMEALETEILKRFRIADPYR